ncbi:MAG TPA: tRNA lysidine(34) synthetase TilS [Bacteroidales bacterium]|nr:tRNA lysidine(34) synthetase TilS [Bacteroidales bacterium]HPS15593.1 tRNA lysidine(34) synthetase TilS [Bacteroidales bacterium]
MLKKFQNFIKKEKLFSANQKILVAVSGGIDSVALCDLMHESGFEFGIAHCNFMLRDKESDGDEKFVKQLAKKINIPFFINRFETGKYADEKKISIQMAARELRYAWFEVIRKKNNYDLIAVAHHGDDEIETFFINLIRGTGIAGLHGIKVKQGNIIRPLLFTSRNEIEKYVHSKKIKFREDSSNSSDKYMRNKIRHKLIPLLKEMNPDVERSIRSAISRVSAIESVFNKVVEKEKNKIVACEKSLIKLDITELLKHDNSELYLYEYLKPFGFTGEIIDNITDSLTTDEGKIFYSSTHRLIKDRRFLIVSSILNEENSLEYFIDERTKSISAPVKMKFSVKENSPALKIKKDKRLAYLDCDKLEFPLKIRKWKTGDFFYPFGMKGKKKLSDFYTDLKFSVLDKENTWLLCNGNDIVWVVGQRTDNRYKIKPKTKKILIIDVDIK